MGPERRARIHRLAAIAGCCVLCTAPRAAPPALNDTGLGACYNDSAVAACGTVATDVGTHPRQDGRYGRDARQLAGTLSKTGSGDRGFDYTRICVSGQNAGTGTCPVSPTPGPSSDDWGCTRDNVTGLYWEIKTTTNTDLRYHSHTYAWLMTSGANGGNAGSVGGNTCNATLPSSQCNSEAYVAAVNALATPVCGFTDWRMPSRLELESIGNHGSVGAGQNPDATYFHLQLSGFWATRNTYPQNVAQVWVKGFNGAGGNVQPKTAANFVRLVRP